MIQFLCKNAVFCKSLTDGLLTESTTVYCMLAAWKLEMQVKKICIIREIGILDCSSFYAYIIHDLSSFIIK